MQDLFWYYLSRILLITAFGVTHGYQLSSKSQTFYTFTSGILSRLAAIAAHFCANSGVGFDILSSLAHGLTYSGTNVFDNQPSTQSLSSPSSIKGNTYIYLKELQTEKGQNLSLTHFVGCTFTNQDKSPLNQQPLELLSNSL